MSYELKPEENEVRLDTNGMIDLEYYYSKADEMQAHYVAAIYSDVKSIIKAFYERFICQDCHPSH